jgi:hypothetical protein
VGRKIDVNDLVGAAEIAERLGISHAQTVHNFVRRYPDFPEPITKLRQAMVWDWNDVAAWAKSTGRLS